MTEQFLTDNAMDVTSPLLIISCIVLCYAYSKLKHKLK